MRSQAEAIIAADHPMQPATEDPPPNAAIGFVGLLLHPYRKWIIRIGIPICLGLLIYGIVRR